MTMRATVLVAFAASLAACGRETEPAAPAPTTEETSPAAVAEPAARSESFTGKVWTATSAESPPGSIRVFLDSGALLQTSCFETYRLSNWRRINGSRIAWREDAAEIEAEIVATDSEHLTLKLQLGDAEEVETYRLAEIPSVCPDMPR